MGSSARKMKREAAKVAYKQFCKNWKEAAAKQDALSPTGHRSGLTRARLKRMEENGEHVLGPRPTFKQWWQAVSSLPSNVKEAVKDQGDIDLEWDDD